MGTGLGVGLTPILGGVLDSGLGGGLTPILGDVLGTGQGGLSPVLGLLWVLDRGVICPPVLGIVVGTGLGICLSLVLGVWWALTWGMICSPNPLGAMGTGLGAPHHLCGCSLISLLETSGPVAAAGAGDCQGWVGTYEGPECLSDTGERNPLSLLLKISLESVKERDSVGTFLEVAGGLALMLRSFTWELDPETGSRRK